MNAAPYGPMSAGGALPSVPTKVTLGQMPAPDERQVVGDLAHRQFAARAESRVERVGPGVSQQHGTRKTRWAAPLRGVRPVTYAQFVRQSRRDCPIGTDGPAAPDGFSRAMWLPRVPCFVANDAVNVPGVSPIPPQEDPVRRRQVVVGLKGALIVVVVA